MVNVIALFLVFYMSIVMVIGAVCVLMVFAALLHDLLAPKCNKHR